jgi:hypothetical protein
MILESGGVSGNKQLVRPDGRALTKSLIIPEVRVVNEGLRAYNVFGDCKELAAAATAPEGDPVLYLMNDDKNRLCVVYSVIVQALDLATTGSFSDTTYFDLMSEYTAPTNGTAKTPTADNKLSAYPADVTAYEGDGGTLLSVTGTGSSRRRVFPQANMIRHEMLDAGSTIILGQSQSITVALITDFVTGKAAAQMSFYMVDRDVDA